MLEIKKNQKAILAKFNISELNEMQQEAQRVILNSSDVVLLSPTGTGKTLAYLLPIISQIDYDCHDVQVLIIVPSRELAIQIEQVIHQMGTGLKTNAVYGGRNVSLDKIDIKHRPAILIGTPGRVADHLRRENFSSEFINTLVLDEFDKSLEVGFESEMSEIIELIPNLKSRILTSATKKVQIPAFVGVKNPQNVDYLDIDTSLLKIRKIISLNKDKLATLVEAIKFIGNEPGIIFCNFKDAIKRVSDYLTEKNISHGCFYGGMEQIDRERALIKFRNGTHQLLVATDLAARGIDIPEIKFIMHYHLPPRSREFIHRNGRTARMNRDGVAYVLAWENDILPDYIQDINPEVVDVENIDSQNVILDSKWRTLFISGGRKDKISKGDIAGLFFKQGNLNKDELGVIEIKQDCAFVGILATKCESVIKLVNNTKLKKKKVRVVAI